MQKNIRKKCINDAYHYLRSTGTIHTQKDVAMKMNASRPNVSAAFSGDNKYLTDNFIERFNSAFGNVFELRWLLTGEGEMLRDIHTDEKMGADSRIADAGHDTLPSTLDKAIDEISEQRKIIMKSQEQIDRLIAVIERMTDARNTT